MNRSSESVRAFLAGIALHQIAVPLALSFGLVVVAGCKSASTTTTPETETPTMIVVTASFPKAASQVVVDKVAVPIEQRLGGMEGLTSIESESKRDSYTAQLRFRPNTDPAAASAAVTSRLAAAEPSLPAEVRQAGVNSRIETRTDPQSEVEIVLTDPKATSLDGMRGWASATTKSLKAAGMSAKSAAADAGLDAFVTINNIDEAKCAALDVDPAVAKAAATKFSEEYRPDGKMGAEFKSRGDKYVQLNEVADFVMTYCDEFIHRVDGQPAVIVRVTPAAGQSVAECSKKAVEIATTHQPTGGRAVDLDRP